ncbi:MAG: hypothetical protein R3C45_16240 [Phycisphaerales bacterium]
MRNLIVTGLLLCVLSGLPGCKSVVSDHLIGEPLEAEQAQAYEGTWRLDDSVQHIKHLDGADLLVAGLEWDEDTFKLNQHHVVVTIHHDTRFAMMAAEDEEDGGAAPAGADGEKPWLLLGMVAASGDDALVLYAPDFDRFKRAFDEGKIQGELSEDGNTLHIKGDKASLDALVNPDTLHELFEMQNPGVMQRVGKLQ